MTSKRKDVQYFEVSGRLVPADSISPGRRMAELAVVLAMSICLAIVVPLLA